MHSGHQKHPATTYHHPGASLVVLASVPESVTRFVIKLVAQCLAVASHLQCWLASMTTKLLELSLMANHPELPSLLCCTACITRMTSDASIIFLRLIFPSFFYLAKSKRDVVHVYHVNFALQIDVNISCSKIEKCLTTFEAKYVNVPLHITICSQQQQQ